MLAVLIFGTIGLSLPFASHPGNHPRFIDALFTATSALSVTGLITKDTPVFWSPVGHVIILSLIQIGGFGVMAIATLLSLATARRLGLSTRINAANETKNGGVGQTKSAVRGIFYTTLVMESTVAVALTLRFYFHYHMSVGTAVWHGIFHSVSAFNNAGFSLYTDSLMPFNKDPWILLPLSTSIVVGGLGFPVVMEVLKRYRMPHFLTMHTKLVLSGTAFLLLAGFVFVLALEWSNPNTLGPMALHNKILNSFFQSVTSRTAGFNAIDTTAMNPATWLVTDILMFIGAGPAGTAGGLKVTTLLIIVFMVRSELRNDRAVVIFNKRLSRSTHRQAITVASMMVILIIAATMALTILDKLPLEQVLFEVTSAISTTGLSTGITSVLSIPSKYIIVVLMFVGRVGPITLGTSLALRRKPVLYTLPKERPIIG